MSCYDLRCHPERSRRAYVTEKSFDFAQPGRKGNSDEQKKKIKFEKIREFVAEQ